MQQNPPPRPPETRQQPPAPAYQEQGWEQTELPEEFLPPEPNNARRVFRIALVLVALVVLLFVLRY
ncbi:MAG: hypothetical protein GX540_07850, partial [Clostridiales bacterium]|nr:hypothetical protein [Clostridiales bacterium]